MRALWLSGLIWWAACYGEPTHAPACTITCTDSCPSDMRCMHGYCVGEGDTCEPTFRTTSAGTGFACALDTQDLLWCWGANDYHQINATDVTSVVRATQIGTRRWDAISAGGGHVCGLRAGHLWCWGRNDHGQVSDVIAGDALEPFEIELPQSGATWSLVVAGYDDTCAIANGSLYCWGAGDAGQLGTGNTIDMGTPTPVNTTLTDWIAVDSESWIYGENVVVTAHSCAISQSAGLHCWGSNGYGELGDGTTTSRFTPTPVALPSPATSVAIGEWSTCATTESQQLYCWGYAFDGGLGDPDVVPRVGNFTRPVLGSNLTGFTRVESSERFACALRDSEVWCWGTTFGGGLGNGVFDTTYWGKVADGASDLSVGWSASIDEVGYDGQDLDLACIIVAGQVQCWGDNRYGQLGQGGAAMQPTPTEVNGDHRFSSLVAGGYHACGIENGNLLCWGSTSSGQANGIIAGTIEAPCGSSPGLACNVSAPTQVAFLPTADQVSGGRYFGCALASGTVTCWGNNGYGQLGSASARSPAQLAGTWTNLFDAAPYGNCGTQNNQTYCWGTVLGASTTPQHVAALDNMSSIGVMGTLDGTLVYAFGCLLQSNQLYCFGDNQQGQFGNGSGDWFCGDGQCTPGEPGSCTTDCPTSTTSCGNGLCDHGETANTCTADCGSPPLTRVGRMYSAISVGWPTRIYQNDYYYLYNPYACGVRMDGRVECWGHTRRGNTAAPANAQLLTPRIVPGLESCTNISASDYHTCAICGGDIYCWGDQRFGGVGALPITNVAVTEPRKLDSAPANDAWAELVSGHGFTCARTTTGRAFCWGFSPYGALGSGGASSPLPIAVQLEP